MAHIPLQTRYSGPREYLNGAPLRILHSSPRSSRLRGRSQTVAGHAWHDRLLSRGVDNLNWMSMSSVAEVAGHALSSVGHALSGPSAFVGRGVQQVHRQEHSSTEPYSESDLEESRSHGRRLPFLGIPLGDQKPVKHSSNAEVRFAADVLD
jgi:hypothetical protein